MTYDRNTHLLDWLTDGYTHCKHGTKEWCEAYLHNARDVILDQDDALTAAEASLSEMRAELERVKGALKPFAEAARKAGYYPHSHLLATREVTIQDFRRAASALASQDEGE